MVGIFNSVGHETEPATNLAASALFGALASAYQALALVESGDAPAANAQMTAAAAQLRVVAPQYATLFAQGSDAPILASAEPTPSPGNVAELQDQLHQFGYSMSLRNRDLFGIAARESRLLADTLEHVAFTGRHADWYGVRDVVHQINRLTNLGVTISRLAAYTGSDPGLQQ